MVDLGFAVLTRVGSRTIRTVRLSLHVVAALIAAGASFAVMSIVGRPDVSSFLLGGFIFVGLASVIDRLLVRGATSVAARDIDSR